MSLKIRQLLDCVPAILWRRANEVVITGSAVLVLNGVIEESDLKDLDLLVTVALFRELESMGLETVEIKGYDPTIDSKDVDGYSGFVSQRAYSEPDKIIQIPSPYGKVDVLTRLAGVSAVDVFRNSTPGVLGLFRMQSIHDFITMKKACKRAKDAKHLRLLKEDT